MIYDDKINEFLNGKALVALSFIAMVITAAMAAVSGEFPSPDGGNGIFFKMSQVFAQLPILSLVTNIAAVTLIGALLLVLNKVFLFVRSVTHIMVSAFFILTMANPLLSCVYSAGTGLALILVLGTFLLFSSYQNKKAQRSIFLVFAIITTCAMYQWAYVLLLPAFFGGYCYMRAMNLKGVLASLLGIFVPFWIALGTGLVSPFDFKPLSIQAVWDALEIAQVRALLVSVAVVVLLSLVLTSLNLFKIFNYRLQLRVYNAFFMLVTFLTVIFMCVDYQDIQVLVPLLNVCLSVQIAHAFTINKASKRYIAMFVFIIWALVSYATILVL